MAVTRREVVLGGAAALALSGCATRRAEPAPVAAEAAPAPRDDPARTFPQSVASGDPTPTGAIVWTRLAPEALVAGRELVLEVASDEGFRNVVATERIPASRLTRGDDCVVRHDLHGHLSPGATFHYRFVYGGAASRTGRLRTLPAPGEMPERLRFAVASCQDYTKGYFNAYDHIAREDVDYILHVGDFLYESVLGPRALPDRRIELPSAQPIATSLDDFRAIHRSYRSDAMLQRALERHTLIAIWDDHDVANDRYWDPIEKRLRAPDHPFDRDPATGDALHAGGIRAWREYFPARVAYDAASASLRDRIRVERAFRFGKLAELVLSDNRLRRDPHPCGEEGPGARFYQMEAKCPGRTAKGRSMLGAEQRRWLVDRLARSEARWKLWGSSVPLTPIGYGSGPSRAFLTLDTWAGFEHERRAILAELGRRGVENLVSIAGDMHVFFAAPLHAVGVDPLRKLPHAVGVELAIGAISAPRLGDIMPLITHPRVVLDHNPQLVFWNAGANGYGFVEVTPDGVRFEPRGFPIDRVLDGAEPEVLGRLLVRHRVPEVVGV